MRNFSEFFEFLSHCNHQTIVDEIREHCTRLIDSKNDKPEILFRFDIERLNTLIRISEWFIAKEFPKMMNEKKPLVDSNEILTVEEVAMMLKLTPQTIYKLIKKGKVQKVEIYTIDKPGVTPKIRVKRGEVERWLDGGGMLESESLEGSFYRVFFLVFTLNTLK